MFGHENEGNHRQTSQYADQQRKGEEDVFFSLSNSGKPS